MFIMPVIPVRFQPKDIFLNMKIFYTKIFIAAEKYHSEESLHVILNMSRCIMDYICHMCQTLRISQLLSINHGSIKSGIKYHSFFINGAAKTDWVAFSYVNPHEAIETVYKLQNIIDINPLSPFIFFFPWESPIKSTLLSIFPSFTTGRIQEFSTFTLNVKSK